MYGNGNATLITRYSETEYLQHPNYPTWYSNGTHTYVHARQYWAGFGWDESVATIYYQDVVVPVEIFGDLSYVASLVYAPFMWAPSMDLSLLDKSGRATIFGERVEVIDILNSVYTIDYFTTRFE